MDHDRSRRAVTTIMVVMIAGVLLASCTGRSSADDPESTEIREPASPTTLSSTPTRTIATPAQANATPALPTFTPTAPTTPSTRCNEASAKAIVEAFIVAYNTGNRVWLASLFPDEAYPYAPTGVQPTMNQHQFRGYFVGELGIGSLHELYGHFAARYAAGEWLTLQDFYGESFGRDPRWELPQMADFAVQLVQEASDIAPRTVIGKGAVNCVDGTINFFLLFDAGQGFVEDQSLLTGEPLDSRD